MSDSLVVEHVDQFDDVDEITLPLPNPCLVVLIGAAGSGKSTLARTLVDQHPDAAIVSYDGCREELTGDAANQSVNPEVVKLALSRVIERCARGLITVVDGTHTRVEQRQAVLDIAAAAGMPAVAVAVATPLRECLARQHTRARRVPVDVIAAQHAGMTAALPGLHQEGFAAVHILNTGVAKASIGEVSGAVLSVDQALAASSHMRLIYGVPVVWLDEEAGDILALTGDRRRAVAVAARLARTTWDARCVLGEITTRHGRLVADPDADDDHAPWAMRWCDPGAEDAVAAHVIRDVGPALDDKPMVVCLCGSTRYLDHLAFAAQHETLLGRIVLRPEVDMRALSEVLAPVAGDPDLAKTKLDVLHRAKIRAADQVMIVAPGGYIGESTQAEIDYARKLGKPVRIVDTAPLIGGHR